MMVNVRRGEGGNIRVVGGRWWEQDHVNDDLAVYLTHPQPGMQLTIGGLSAGLSEDDEKTLVAIHEVGHVVAIHGLGLEFGETRIFPEDPEFIGTEGVVTQLGRTEFPEPSTLSPQQSATVSLSAWIATEIWLQVEGKGSQLHSWFVQSHAAHDHHLLLNRPTTEPTAFLYGPPMPPQGWQGEVLRVDQFMDQLTDTLRGQWETLSALADIVLRENSASRETIIEVLGSPGWMN